MGCQSALMRLRKALRDREALSKAANSGRVASKPRPIRRIPDQTGHSLDREWAGVPNDPGLPLLLDKVHPIREIVHVDHYSCGCPPSADAIRKFLSDLIGGATPYLPYPLRHFD